MKTKHQNTKKMIVLRLHYPVGLRAKLFDLLKPIASRENHTVMLGVCDEWEERLADVDGVTWEKITQEY